MNNPSHNDFARMFFAHDGKLIDKWEQYLGAYEAELGGLCRRGAPLDLLEIGIQNGGSLEFWIKLLPPGSTVTGLDIDPRVGSLTFGEAAISTHILDASDPAQVDAALGDATYDIIVDDGSHICADVVSGLRQFYPRLRLGGLMFIEDLHTSYSAVHGGGYGNSESSIEYLKHAIDLLNVDHFSAEQGEPLEALLPATMRETLGSLVFYDSLVMLRKMTGSRERPWRRLISGDASQIVSFADWICHESRSVLGNIAFGDLAARNFEHAFMEACGDHKHNDQIVEAMRTKQRAVKQLLDKVDLDLCELDAPGPEGTQGVKARLEALVLEIKGLLHDEDAS